MATEELFRDDGYLKQCDATVVSVEDRRVVVDRTVFYPEGGGQPGDGARGAFEDAGDRVPKSAASSAKKRA